MKDFDGADTAGIEHIRKEFLRVADLYGFEHADPSPLESLSTLETRSGPAIRDEIYNFEDKGGREVALRFDFTMGLARRAASQRSERLPSKVSSFGGVFRYDEPQHGRYRYFHQWDLEIFGKPTMEVDAEIIEATSVLYDSLGLGDVSIRVCHRKLVESKIRQIFGADISDEMIVRILRAVDKAAKRSRTDILSEFEHNNGNDHNTTCDRDPAADMSGMLGQVLDFAGVKGSASDVDLKLEMSGLDSSWNYLASLYDLLAGRGIRNVEINLGIVRGLDYYSGMVFEVFDSSGDSPDTLGALAGGGRYDALTAAFGRDDLGAAGVAGGVERTILAMRKNDSTRHPYQSQRRVAVLYASPEVRLEVAQIASGLRRNGIATNFDIVGKSLKKQLGEASQSRAYAVVIVGPRELKGGEATLRIMDTGAQRTISLHDLRRDPHSALEL